MNSYRSLVGACLCLLSTVLVAAQREDGFVDIMPKAQVAKYQAMLPRVADAEIDSLLRDPRTMWYDSQGIVPGYQDSMGDPKGFRPNTIESILIDLAVPGGWGTIFQKRGRFNFPFATGGADLAENMEKINFWSVPRAAGAVLPVVYWKLPFSRWRWMFPVGTVIGEVLMVKLPDGSLKVFEIRTRRRELNRWTNAIFRPYPTAFHLAEKIQQLRPDWVASPEWKKVIRTLMDEGTLTPRTLETASFPGTFTKLDGHLDPLPDFPDATLANELLSDATFFPMDSMVWKAGAGHKTYAPTSRSLNSIVPKNYDAGVLSVDDDSCRRCHKDAGRQIGEFHFNLILYGELWGEDEIFSWHPFDNNAFVDASGNVKNFNDDNRRLRSDFVAADLVKPYQPAVHTGSFYKELPRDWKYNPVR